MSEEKQPVPGAVPDSDVDSSPPLILLAEDEAALRRLLARRLTSRACRVVEVADGRALHEYLLMALEGQPGFPLPDLVLSDVEMPYLSGPVALSDFMTARGEIPVIFMSGGALPIPGVPFLRKPFRLATLQALLEELLGG